MCSLRPAPEIRLGQRAPGGWGPGAPALSGEGGRAPDPRGAPRAGEPSLLWMWTVLPHPSLGAQPPCELACSGSRGAGGRHLHPRRTRGRRCRGSLAGDLPGSLLLGPRAACTCCPHPPPRRAWVWGVGPRVCVGSPSPAESPAGPKGTVPYSGQRQGTGPGSSPPGTWLGLREGPLGRVLPASQSERCWEEARAVRLQPCRAAAGLSWHGGGGGPPSLCRHLRGLLGASPAPGRERGVSGKWRAPWAWPEAGDWGCCPPRPGTGAPRHPRGAPRNVPGHLPAP